MIIPAKKFYMIRHGQSVANEGQYFSGNLDVALTDLGRAQAEQARQIVEGLDDKPTHIVHSHLQRARITAEIINQNLKLSMTELSEIGEHNFGQWEKQPWGEMRARFHAGENPPGGETHDAFITRIKKALNTALSMEGTPLIACHGGVFRAFNRMHDADYEPTENCVLYVFNPIDDNPSFPWDIKKMG